jgi:hypothetical protein
MKQAILLLIVAFAVGGGAVVFTTLSRQPAKADSGVRVDPSQIMTDAKDLPVAQYVDYCVVFCPTE